MLLLQLGKSDRAATLRPDVNTEAVLDRPVLRHTSEADLAQNDEMDAGNSAGLKRGSAGLCARPHVTPNERAKHVALATPWPLSAMIQKQQEAATPPN